MKTEHAAAAAQIRKKLKDIYPRTQFGVRSKAFSMGTSITVDWVNGPPSKEVEALLAPYCYGHFNGSDDIYEVSNRNKDIPQVKFLSCNREVEESILQTLFLRMVSHYEGWAELRNIGDQSFEFKNRWRFWTPREYLLNLLQNKDLTEGLNGIAI